MNLLNEIELTFPQREASVMNNEIFDKINHVRTKYMDFDTSTSDPFPSNFFLGKQRISEKSQKIAREHVYGYLDVIKNLKVSFFSIYCRKVESRFHSFLFNSILIECS